MIEWALLTGGVVATAIGTLSGFRFGRTTEQRLSADRLFDARHAGEGELRRQRRESNLRIEDLERERTNLRRALCIDTQKPHSGGALARETLARMAGFAFIENAVLSDSLGLELASVHPDSLAVELGAMGPIFFQIESLFPQVAAYVTQARDGMHVESRAFRALGERAALVVACKGQRPSSLALDASLAYAESIANSITASSASGTVAHRGHRYLHSQESESARALSRELMGFRSDAGLLGVTILDGRRVLAGACEGGAPLSTLEALADAWPVLVADTGRRLASEWVRSDLIFPDGSSMAIRRVSPKGRFMLVAQSERPVSDIELDRISGRLRRVSGTRPVERAEETARTS